MAARTRLLQLAIAAVNLIIVALVFTSVWPFPSGEFKVNLPSANDVEWAYSDGVVHIIAPYTIDNGWIYDVDDLTITYSVTNGTHSELAGDVLTIGSIPAGDVRSDELDFEFDLLEQYGAGIDWMVFHEDMLFFHLEVSCWYTMKMIQFDATYQASVPWDALVQGYGISDYSYSVGPPVSVYVGYWLNTSSLLRGLPAADVTVSYFGDDTLLGQAQTTIQLGGPNVGAVTMDITPALASTYSLLFEVQFGGFTVSQRQTASVPPGVIP